MGRLEVGPSDGGAMPRLVATTRMGAISFSEGPPEEREAPDIPALCTVMKTARPGTVSPRSASAPLHHLAVNLFPHLLLDLPGVPCEQRQEPLGPANEHRHHHSTAPAPPLLQKEARSKESKIPPKSAPSQGSACYASTGNQAIHTVLPMVSRQVTTPQTAWVPLQEAGTAAGTALWWRSTPPPVAGLQRHRLLMTSISCRETTCTTSLRRWSSPSGHCTNFGGGSHGVVVAGAREGAAQLRRLPGGLVDDDDVAALHLLVHHHVDHASAPMSDTVSADVRRLLAPASRLGRAPAVAWPVLI